MEQTVQANGSKPNDWIVARRTDTSGEGGGWPYFLFNGTEVYRGNMNRAVFYATRSMADGAATVLNLQRDQEPEHPADEKEEMELRRPHWPLSVEEEDLAGQGILKRLHRIELLLGLSQ